MLPNVPALLLLSAGPAAVAPERAYDLSCCHLPAITETDLLTYERIAYLLYMPHSST